MKLIKCYIENFGMLSQYSCDFSAGLNCIFSKNSTGKTTLSVFIRAMLYGLSDTRKSDLDENDRKKYLPWQGGIFGGSLSLEIAGKRYTIERSFGERPSQDKFCLRNFDTGAISYDYTSDFGEEVFGIDREGFSNTVFFTESNSDGKKGYTSVAARLSVTDAGVGAHCEYERAMSLLEDRRRYYSKRGGGGEISQIEARLDSLDRELDRLSGITDNLTNEARELSLIRENVRELEKKRSELTEKIGKESALNAERKRLDQLRAIEEQERAALSKAETFFGGHIPTQDEIDRARDDYSEARRLLSECEDGISCEEKKRMTEAYRGKLSWSELHDTESNLERLEQTEARIKNMEENRDPHSHKISEPPPSGNSKQVSAISGKRKSDIPKKIWCALYIIFGAVLGVIGVCLGIFDNKLFYLLGAFGLSAIIYGVVKALVLQMQADGKKSAGYGRDIDGKLSIYAAEKELRGRELAQLYEEKYLLEKQVDDFLARFDTQPIFERRGKLKFITEDYGQYYTAFVTGADVMTERKRRAEELNKRTSEFVSRYAITSSDPFAEIRMRLNEYEYKRAILDRTTKERKALEVRLGAESQSANKPDESDIIESIRELDGKLKELRQELTLKENAHRNSELEAMQYDEVAAKAASCRHMLEEYTKNLSVIKKTAELLKEASQNLTEKYLDKIKQRLAYYCELLGSAPKEFKLSPNFIITKSERGATRLRESYSRGIKELEALALQLSLCDSLYEKDMPFLVLDDPFISLDDDKCQRGKKMLIDMAKDRQILYFTCSTVRAFR